jgi:23S rRNA (guanosine2251-2'-O)-methyltransferase
MPLIVLKNRYYGKACSYHTSPPIPYYYDMPSKLPLILVLNNIRSAYNVGAIWRTADAAGIEQIITIGITPHPKLPKDPRLPHIIDLDIKALAKTALGAEHSLPFNHYDSLTIAAADLAIRGYKLCALEQSRNSESLFSLRPQFPMALILGSEPAGLSDSELALASQAIEIPQFGGKESLNVSVAAGVAVYFLRYFFDTNQPH